MRKTLKKTFLLLSIVTFGLSLFSVLQFWDYQETWLDINQSLQQKVSNDELNQEIETALNNAQFDDARMYLDIAKTNHFTIDFQKYQSKINQKDTQLRQIVSGISDFTAGFIKGKSGNMAGIAGSVSADFTVIGDVRDLRKQYLIHQQDEDVNELLVLLSGAGIGLTALTIGSAGSMAPVKAGASIMKVALKSQRITMRFQKQLLKLGRKIFDWPGFLRLTKKNKSISNLRRAVNQAYHPEALKPLSKIAGRVNSIRKSSSTADAIHFFKYVESSDDLRHLEKISLKYGSQTKGIMKLLGKGALRTVRVLRKTTELFISILSSIVSGLLSLFFTFATRKT